MVLRLLQILPISLEPIPEPFGGPATTHDVCQNPRLLRLLIGCLICLVGTSFDSLGLGNLNAQTETVVPAAGARGLIVNEDNSHFCLYRSADKFEILSKPPALQFHFRPIW